MRKMFLALVFLYAINSPAFCQSNASGSTGPVAKLKSFYTGRIIEKAYLHFDRPYYWAGDAIYFKAYVTYGEQHELSNQSGVLDVDLIGPQGNFIRSLKLQLKGGVAWGDFELPALLSVGNYKVRAYTQVMKDAGLTDFFEQTIVVNAVNGANNTAYKPIQGTNKPEIQFFPEGGSLVTGINSKVAFKAIDADGMGINVKGIVVDNTGKTVAVIDSRHLGMGYFYLQPEDGKTYKANITFANGVQGITDLSPAAMKGIVLTINNSDPDKLSILISCNKAYYDENQNKELSLVINSGIAVSSGRIKLANQLLSIDLKKSQFRTGVVQLTLFSPAGEPVAERLVFINRPDLLQLNVNTNKASFNPREKVSVSISAKNKSDSLVAGNFSVAVINETKVPVDENKENTILSWLLLSSDLKGDIEEPNYYFAHADTVRSANLDVLMLTQGYRRFVWKQLLADKYPPLEERPENGLEITGHLTSLTNSPIIKEKINLVSLDGGPILNALTDSTGRFSFNDLDFANGARFVLKPGSPKSKNTSRLTYDKYQPSLIITNTGWMPGPISIDSVSGKRPAINGGELKVAEAATITEDYNSNHNPEGVTNADQVLHNKDLGDGVLTDKLAVLLNDVQYTNGNFYIRENISGTLLHPENMLMLVVVDGVKGVSLDGLQTTDVETVEVLKNTNASSYGANGSGGVLVVTTRKGKDPVDATTTGVLQITPTGFYKAREFYSPKYDNPAFAAKQADMRSTIYWKPELRTEKNGSASFDFYNADGKGTCRVVVEGIDEHGNLGRQVYRYKVE